MKGKLYWGLGVLIILLLGVNAFLLLRNTDTEPKFVYKDVTAEQLDNIRNQIKSTQKPSDEPCSGCVNCDDHSDKVGILQTPETPILSNEVQKSQPVQVASIADRVSDLKEYLNFFESFGDDPSLDEYERFKEKHSQYYAAMRDFDDRNASSEQAELVRQINQKITTVQTNVFAKKSALQAEYRANRLATTDPKLIYGPIIASPNDNINTEGGEK